MTPVVASHLVNPALTALDQISMRVDVKFVKDMLNGDDATEIRVSLREVLSAAAGGEYHDE